MSEAEKITALAALRGAFSGSLPLSKAGRADQGRGFCWPLLASDKQNLQWEEFIPPFFTFTDRGKCVPFSHFWEAKIY